MGVYFEDVFLVEYIDEEGNVKDGCDGIFLICENIDLIVEEW